MQFRDCAKAGLSSDPQVVTGVRRTQSQIYPFGIYFPTFFFPRLTDSHFSIFGFGICDWGRVESCTNMACVRLMGFVRGELSTNLAYLGLSDVAKKIGCGMDI